MNNEFAKAEIPALDVNEEIPAYVYSLQAWPWLQTEFERLAAFDRYTYIHSIRVATIARLIAEELGYRQEGTGHIVLGALLHDLGKLKIPLAVLNKPGKLTTEEMAIIKQHPVLGEEMLRDKHLPLDVTLVIYQHHERWDGRGYPDGLYGMQIHPFAQIVAVADVYDALTAVRPYREAIPGRVAYEMVLAGAGRDFDDEVIEAFRRVVVRL